MEQERLFADEGPAAGDRGGKVEAPRGAPRLVTADREQLELRSLDLDSLLAHDHRARTVWQLVERLDLSAFYDWIKARGSHPGRAPTDPKVLVALWLFATMENVGKARALDRLSREHDAYRWLRGGVPLNYHMLSDFRVDHEKALDALFTQLLAVLSEQGLVRLERVAQDGMRVRASAGEGTFRRRKRLKKILRAAKERVELLKHQLHDVDAPSRPRQKAAQERAARERVERVDRALAELKEIEEMRAEQTGGRKSRSEPRASSTDPEARKMRMGDGGFRPAYNVQLATDTESQVIVGVQVTNVVDQGAVEPMLDELEERLGRYPKEYLVDGAFAVKFTVEETARRGVTLYAPVGARGNEEPHRVRDGDSQTVAAWRRRMKSKQGKEIYKERAAVAEHTNADLKTWRTLDRFNVRGLNKVSCIALWSALAYNLMRWVAHSATAS